MRIVAANDVVAMKAKSKNFYSLNVHFSRGDVNLTMEFPGGNGMRNNIDLHHLKTNQQIN